jgi:hypothetical protein
MGNDSDSEGSDSAPSEDNLDPDDMIQIIPAQ